MFEKEAEEYAIENYETCLYDDLPYANDSRAREQSFKDGAEFAYNKANEWHSTKNVACYEDFCLPPEAEWKDKRAIWKVQVIHKNGIREPFCYHCGSFDDLWHDINAHHVIAWKEIVPPKETE